MSGAMGGAVGGAMGGAMGGAAGYSGHLPGPSSSGDHLAVASDYGTTGTLSASTPGYARRPAAQVPSTSRGYGSEYSDYGRAGPPPYEAVPSHTETSM